MNRRLRIVHVFRAPAGGLFRHVRDLVRGQAGMGHEIGMICDATSGGASAETALNTDRKLCWLGIHRIAIDRLPGLSDLGAARSIARLCAPFAPDIIHGHGAKGGVYARLAGRILDIPSLYTPHGGSLHYAWASAKGAVFLSAERLLLGRGNGLLFVCNFERDQFERKIGLGQIPNRVVHNGLWPEEFAAVEPGDDAADIVFVGELRELKGISDLLEALALLMRWRPITAQIAGDGPDRGRFEDEARRLGLQKYVTFTGSLPAREAFVRGRVLAIPSRAESFPYIVLEAAAAQLPLVATAVGGIPEAVPPEMLVPPQQPGALAAALRTRLEAIELARINADRLAQNFRARFAAQAMCEGVTSFYTEVLARSGPRG